MDETDIKDGRVNPGKIGGPWKSTLFGCFKDLPTCLCGFCCTSCLFGTNAEKIDGSNCIGFSIIYCLGLHCYLCWIPHMMKRKIMRQKYGLKEDPCDDCLVTAFCGPCALCQESRELKLKAGPRAGVLPVRSQPVAYRR